MLIVQNDLTNNPCYKQQRYITVKGLMLHSVGCNCSKASRFLKSFNSPNASAMVHGFIDAESGIIYQTAPWNMRCWHSSSGKNGRAYDWMIGVEMCESEYIQYMGGATFKVLDYEKAKAHVMTAYRSAVELFAWLCIRYDLDPLEDGVILSHREGHRRGIASNHGDPEHLWSQMGLPITMDVFRNDVAERVKAMIEEAIKKYLASLSNLPVSEWAKEDWERAIKAGITDGTAPQRFITRQEVISLLYRMGDSK